MPSIMPTVFSLSTLELQKTEHKPCVLAGIIVDGSTDLGSTLGGLGYIIVSFSVTEI